jgi:hypothetical protein
MKKLIIAMVSLAMLGIVPGISSAGQQASKTSTANGYSHTMCSLESSTGVCDANGANDLYAIVEMYERVTFTLHTPGNSVCDIYASTEFEPGVESAADISVYGGDKINSTSLSTTQEKIEYYNLSYKYMWVLCTTNDATSTVIMQGSVGLKR